MRPQPALDIILCNASHSTRGKTLSHVRRMLDQIYRRGLEAHNSVGNHAVDMLVEAGVILDAEKLFVRLVSKTERSWNALANAYAKSGDLQHAFMFYQKMQESSIHPSDATYVSLLNACSKLKDVERGCQLHSEIAAKGSLQCNRFVSNALVDMYAKCGLIEKANEVFDMIPTHDVVTWTALIGGYARHENSVEAPKCYQQMLQYGVSPNALTYTCSLKACGTMTDLDNGKEFHARIEAEGLLKENVVLGNALVDMYAKCSSLERATQVFDMLEVRNVFAWNALIAGYAQHNFGEEALNCYEQMQLEGVSADDVTYTCTLKACALSGAMNMGRDLRGEIEAKGLLKTNKLVGNALVDMYVKCGELAKAREVFHELQIRDLVAWNALIIGYIEDHCEEEALALYKKMQLADVRPDAITIAAILKACGTVGAIELGRDVHESFERRGVFENDLGLSSILVDMYAKLGLLWKAQEEFDKLVVRDAVTWTALLAGYLQHEYGEEALHCFEQMQKDGVLPDAVAFVCSLKACSIVVVLEKGQEIHVEIARNGMLNGDLNIGNGLVHMYAKCGMLAMAQEVFDTILSHDVVSRTSLLTGYAQQGQLECVLTIYESMRGECQESNFISFVNILNACSHAGLVAEGQAYFWVMFMDHGIVPSVEHHTCMVDLFGRAGQLDMAVAMMELTPFYDNVTMWHSVLGACRKWGDIEIGRQAFEQALQVDETGVGAYISMCNIYADAGLFQDAQTVDGW